MLTGLKIINKKGFSSDWKAFFAEILLFSNFKDIF
jgi:hypothetical protein